ncbi:transcription factor E2F isoform 1 [Galdieria sulphuraria]|uniref:Transcription factor E2F isoform 1 n=1 Tax=Galdieria sulphuraria TaxID=130081 RepID=M2WWC3_GALSU|nr:transcription factor E2F isoform 1 [Galdieria sulphuraria]EME28310.1 transcription factor E2F isoform 1 [Galdieria sulphuraria]|eukprot:XP_005704830.1 transcription factor E2F isoform 1 [Galdieria sulphuraria]
MEDKFLGDTDRKSQLFFPENFKTKKANVQGYIDFHNHQSHTILEEVKKYTALYNFVLRRLQFLDIPITWTTEVSDYLSQDNFHKREKSSENTGSPFCSFEKCQKVQEHLCNFASTTALKEFSSPSEYSFSTIADNGRQDHPEELEKGEKLRYPRKERMKQSSLFDLTARFFDILLHSPNGTVDLNFASRKLDVRKRRLYDVLNVCEGVGILDKATKNCVKLRENGAETMTNMQKFLDLQRQLKMLEDEESEVDRELLMHNNPENRSKRNRSHCRLSTVFSKNHQKELFIEAPAGSVLSVLKPKLSTDGVEWLYQIAVKSTGGQVAYKILSDTDRVPQEPNSSSKQSRKSFNLTKYWPCETVSMSTK